MAHHFVAFKAHVAEWVRVPTEGESRDDFPRSPSQRHRSRLQSPGANVEAPSSIACDELWDDFSSMAIPDIHQREYNDSLGPYGPQPHQTPAAEATDKATCHDPSFSTIQWNTTRGVRTKGGPHTDSWTSQGSLDVGEQRAHSQRQSCYILCLVLWGSSPVLTPPGTVGF